jgi:hypothetical protein
VVCVGVSSRALAYYYALQQYNKDEGLPKDEALAKHMGKAFGRHSPVIETLLAHRYTHIHPLCLLHTKSGPQTQALPTTHPGDTRVHKFRVGPCRLARDY